MNIMQWIRSTLQRPISLGALFKEKEEILPVEPDPVGEFLESKKKGINPAEQVTGEGPPVARAAPQEVGQALEASRENTTGSEKVEAARAEAQPGSAVQPEAKVETAATVLTDSEKKETSKVEAGATAVLSESKLEAKIPEPVGQNIEAANTQPGNSPQEDKKIESVLDVFRSEELAVDTTSTLSKELSDMDVYSLLEEIKQIADIAKKVKKVG